MAIRLGGETHTNLLFSFSFWGKSRPAFLHLVSEQGNGVSLTWIFDSLSRKSTVAFGSVKLEQAPPSPSPSEYTQRRTAPKQPAARERPKPHASHTREISLFCFERGDVTLLYIKLKFSMLFSTCGIKPRGSKLPQCLTVLGFPLHFVQKTLLLALIFRGWQLLVCKSFCWAVKPSLRSISSTTIKSCDSDLARKSSASEITFHLAPDKLVWILVLLAVILGMWGA